MYNMHTNKKNYIIVNNKYKYMQLYINTAVAVNNINKNKSDNFSFLKYLKLIKYVFTVLQKCIT